MHIAVSKRYVLGVLSVIVVAFWWQSETHVRSEELRQQTEAVAKKVEEKAERTEKAEGKSDLVKDTVKVKTDTDGELVIEQKGEASFYGKGFHGKTTADGEKFNQHDRTAAHPTLPLGSEATVTNLDTGKSVEVEINDRGPYVKGRDIDLSKQAAEDIGLDAEGAAPVKIEAKIPPPERHRHHRTPAATGPDADPGHSGNQ
ncbi:MAG: septal ring lytic transglycosylase RlpA family protein [Porticoccaceae bacterium]